MTNEELKQALFDGQPVILNSMNGDTEYKCVSAIVYRCIGGRIVASAEVLDKRCNSVVYCDPKRLSRKGQTDSV